MHQLEQAQYAPSIVVHAERNGIDGAHERQSPDTPVHHWFEAPEASVAPVVPHHKQKEYG